MEVPEEVMMYRKKQSSEHLVNIFQTQKLHLCVHPHKNYERLSMNIHVRI